MSKVSIESNSSSSIVSFSGSNEVVDNLSGIFNLVWLKNLFWKRRSSASEKMLWTFQDRL